LYVTEDIARFAVLVVIFGTVQVFCDVTPCR